MKNGGACLSLCVAWYPSNWKRMGFFVPFFFIVVVVVFFFSKLPTFRCCSYRSEWLHFAILLSSFLFLLFLWGGDGGWGDEDKRRQSNETTDYAILLIIFWSSENHSILLAWHGLQISPPKKKKIKKLSATWPRRIFNNSVLTFSPELTLVMDWSSLISTLFFVSRQSMCGTHLHCDYIRRHRQNG